MSAATDSLTADQKKRLVVGDWRLDQREESSNWYRVGYNKEEARTVWLSLRTDDFETAYRKLLALVAANPSEKLQPPSEVALFDALTWYWENHAKGIASSASASTSIDYWKEWWKPSHMIDDVTPKMVDKFVVHLRTKQCSEGYISRVLRVGRAALNAYRDNLFVAWVPKIKDNQTQADKDGADPLGRPLELEELARLVRYANVRHLYVFMMIMLNTLCRPGAAMELAKKQVDFKKDQVKLNPEGRRQTKKWRPVLPVTPFLRDVLVEEEAIQRKEAEARGEYDFKMKNYVVFQGEPIESIKTAWRGMVEAAGFVIEKEDGVEREEITPYSLRHTMARVLREARVYEEERSVFLGHKRKGSARTSAIYSPDDPKYLKEPAAAIQDFMEKLGTEIARQETEMEKAA